MQASPCARRPLASAGLSCRLPRKSQKSSLDRGHSLPALWARAWGSATRQLGVCWASSVVARTSECQCSGSRSNRRRLAQGTTYRVFGKPSSPDLDPLDHSVWSTIEAGVQRQKPTTVHHLRWLIVWTFDDLSSADADRVVGQYVKRLRAYVAADSVGTVEQMIGNVVEHVFSLVPSSFLRFA